MWVLKDSKGKIKYIKPGKIVTVGRKQADIILESDSSISRCHAEITVTLKEQMKISEASSVCTITDINSKYGTFINRKKLEIKVPKEGIELEPHDRIRFGLQKHIFTLEYISFVTVISRLSLEHKNKLKAIMDCIGGIVIDSYDNNCTHLTATTATSTNKIISALIAGIPIINIEYWMDVVKAVDTDSYLPDPNIFTLMLQDKGVNSKRVSLKPNPNRKTLFEGKTFIFFCETTIKEYKKMIKDAGGKAEFHSINVEDIPENLFVDNNIIMQIPESYITDRLAVFNTMLYNKMQERQIRMIAESEIPLAIVYVSLDQYCNPKFHFKELMKRKTHKQDTAKVLVLDTQEILPEVSHSRHLRNKPTTSTASYIPDTDDMCPLNISEPDSSVNIEITTKTHNIKKNSSSVSKSNIELQQSKVAQEDLNLEQCDKNINFKNTTSFVEQSSKIQKTEYTDDKIQDQNDKKSLNMFETKIKEVKSHETNERITIVNEKNSAEVICDTQPLNIVPSKSTNISSDNEKTQNRKRQNENSYDDDWKSTERINVAEINKRRRISSMISDKHDDYKELKQQKTKIKENKQDKLSEWGFKKSEKKNIDFDLDDIEIDEPKKNCEETIHNGKADQIKKSLSLENLEESLQFYGSIKNNEAKNSIEVKSNFNSCSKENIKNLPNSESFKTIDSSKSIQVKKEVRNPFYVKLQLNSESNIGVINNYKTFKKVSNPVPIKRIALSSMTLWK